MQCLSQILLTLCSPNPIWLLVPMVPIPMRGICHSLWGSLPMWTMRSWLWHRSHPLQDQIFSSQSKESHHHVKTQLELSSVDYPCKCLIITANYIFCTETGNGDQPPLINLGNHGGSVLIASPQYPSVYYQNSNCHWSFEASSPDSVIELEVNEWTVS